MSSWGAATAAGRQVCISQPARHPPHLGLQALFGTLTPDVVVLTILYSLAGLGIAIVNDFKSIEGDR